MKRLTSFAAGACALAVAGASVPALAQYANEYVPPKVRVVGKTSHATSKGSVSVQVEVDPNGAHKVVRIISSTNHADDAAAREIAQNSSYIPARRGKTPIRAFYDFKLTFNGSSVAHAKEPAAAGNVARGGATMSGADAVIDGMIRSGKYAQAVDAANNQLSRDPGDQTAQQLLGVAEYYNSDIPASAAAFSKVQRVSPTYAQVAAQAYAGAGDKLIQSDPAQALDYAKRGAAISQNPNTRYVLGVAYLANKQYPQSITELKAVHDSPGLNVKTKANVDAELMQAYLATGDEADANAMNAEIHQLDPSSTIGSHTMAIHYLQIGIDAMKTKDFAGAVKDFDQAAATGSSQDAVTADTYAAFSYLNMPTPNYDQARAYGLKAVAGAPDSPEANYAVGEAYAGTYTTSQRPDDKQKAIDYLTKADTYAKTAGNTALSQKAEAQIKNISSSSQ